MTVLRSMLFAPGNHARRVEKALSLQVDAVILDLEDAVANTEKAATRELVVAALSAPRRCLGYVRVNALGTEWAYGDLVAVVRSGVDGIVLPKGSARRFDHETELAVIVGKGGHHIPRDRAMEHVFDRGGARLRFPAYRCGDDVVWGMTERLVTQLLAVARRSV